MTTRCATSLALVLVACATACSKTPDDRAAPVAAKAGPASALTPLLPADNAVSGWTKKSSKLYGSDGLWEFIDGGAESYLACGYQEVITSEYVNPAAPAPVLIDIYRLSDPRGAFGIYSQETNPGADFRPIGAEGYVHGTVVNFWSGPYYVKLTTFRESEELKRGMLELAQAVSSKMGPPVALPVEVGWFPRDGLVAHTVRHLPVKVLGQPYLSNGFEARYRDGRQEYGVALVTVRDGEDSNAAFARYREHAASTSKNVRSLTGAGGDEGFTATGASGVVVAVRQANHLAIAVDAPSVETAMPRLRALLANAQKGGK